MSLVPCNSVNYSFLYSPSQCGDQEDPNTSVLREIDLLNTTTKDEPSSHSQGVPESTLSQRVNSQSKILGTQTSSNSTDSHRTAKTVRRSLLDPNCDQNLAPSVSNEDILAVFDRDLVDDEVKQHAYMRMQMCTLLVTAMYKVAVGSDPNEAREINVRIGRTYLQIGKGSKEFNAAHPNPLAGITDDWREVAIKRIAKSLKITPLTKNLLVAKGFTDEEFRRLENNCYQAEVLAESFERVWPRAVDKPSSLIFGTNVEYILNATSRLPASVNLFCDCSLERDLQPCFVELLQKSMRGTMTREEVIDQYCQMIWNHFRNLEAEIMRRQACMESYQASLAMLLEDEGLSDQEIFDAVRELKQINEEMQSVPHTAFKYSKMKLNEKFINEIGNSDVVIESSVANIKIWLNQRKSDLSDEAQKYSSRLCNYLRFTRLEYEGTSRPDFDLLFGKENFIDLQNRLLSQRETQDTPKRGHDQVDNSNDPASQQRGGLTKRRSRGAASQHV